MSDIKDIDIVGSIEQELNDMRYRRKAKPSLIFIRPDLYAELLTGRADDEELEYVHDGQYIPVLPGSEQQELPVLVEAAKLESSDVGSDEGETK